MGRTRKKTHQEFIKEMQKSLDYLKLHAKKSVKRGVEE